MVLSIKVFIFAGQNAAYYVYEGLKGGLLVMVSLTKCFSW